MTTYKLFPEYIELTSDITDVVFNSDEDLSFILRELFLFVRRRSFYTI